MARAFPSAGAKVTIRIFPMAKYIEMPKLADTMTEGTLVKWLSLIHISEPTRPY